MRTVRTSEDVTLVSGLNEIVIESDRDIHLTLTARENCDVFVRIVRAKSLSVRTFTHADVTASILFWNEAETEIHVDETHDVLRNGNLTVAYSEVNNAPTDRHTYVALREEGAQALVSSASLVTNDKSYVMEVVSFAPHTSGNMKNFAVMMNGGKLNIDAIGKIVKGAYRSESHQTSRALAFEQGQHATIVPELLIDEDDVQASHAMSMGSVDPDHLYYMQTRGLSLSQCISLISTGYLLPIADTLSDENMRASIREKLESELAALC